MDAAILIFIATLGTAQLVVDDSVAVGAVAVDVETASHRWHLHPQGQGWTVTLTADEVRSLGADAEVIYMVNPSKPALTRVVTIRRAP